MYFSFFIFFSTILHPGSLDLIPVTDTCIEKYEASGEYFFKVKESTLIVWACVCECVLISIYSSSCKIHASVTAVKIIIFLFHLIFILTYFYFFSSLLSIFGFKKYLLIFLRVPELSRKLRESFCHFKYFSNFFFENSFRNFKITLAHHIAYRTHLWIIRTDEWTFFNAMQVLLFSHRSIWLNYNLSRKMSAHADNCLSIN